MSHETCPECDQPLRLCNCAQSDRALAYLRRLHDARAETNDDDWLRADRFLRASLILLGVEGERLNLKGIQAVSALAIELAEEIGH